MLITFSGLDGAGKSTLIAYLEDTFRRRQQRVAVLHLNDQVGIHAYLRMLRDRLRNNSRAELAPGIADPRSQKIRRPAPGGVRGVLARLRALLLWNKVVRRVFYPVDLVIFLGYRAYLEWLSGRVLIMDRYFYDTLVDLTPSTPRWWNRMLQKLTPAPTISVWLDVSPEESFRRKGEFSVEYLRRRQTAYQDVLAAVPSLVRIANTNLESTKAALLSAIASRQDQP
jgi:thymidylate kinase